MANVKQDNGKLKRWAGTISGAMQAAAQAGWTFVDPVMIKGHNGEDMDLLSGSPALIKRKYAEVLRFSWEKKIVNELGMRPSKDGAPSAIGESGNEEAPAQEQRSNPAVEDPEVDRLAASAAPKQLAMLCEGQALRLASVVQGAPKQLSPRGLPFPEDPTSRNFKRKQHRFPQLGVHGVFDTRLIVLVCGAWCVVRGVWCVVCGVWCVVHVVCCIVCAACWCVACVVVCCLFVV